MVFLFRYGNLFPDLEKGFKMVQRAWRLVFTKGLLLPFFSGETILTFRVHRPGSNDFECGQLIEGHFLEGVVFLLKVVSDVKVKPFEEITHEECKEWARFTHEDMTNREMMRIMCGHYPELKGKTLAAIIELKILVGGSVRGNLFPTGSMPERPLMLL